MADNYLVIKIFSTFADNPLNYKWSDRLFPYSLKPVNLNYMKKLFAIIAICSICICTSCESMTDDRSNPVAGTTWEWSEDPITWTFTFSDNEVTFDYKAIFSPSDISTSQYKSIYTYAQDIVKFNMKVWSDIEWECSGIISDNTMQLSSKGTEAWDIVLTKK